MACYRITLSCDHSAEEVFDYLADLRHVGEWDRSVRSSTKLSDGPIGLGTRFGVTVGPAVIGPRLSYTLVSFERPERLVAVASSRLARSGGLRSTDTITVRSLDARDGSRPRSSGELVTAACGKDDPASPERTRPQKKASRRAAGPVGAEVTYEACLELEGLLRPLTPLTERPFRSLCDAAALGLKAVLGGTSLLSAQGGDDPLR